MEFKTKGIMRYFLIIILGLFLWTGCNDDDEKLTPSTEPECPSARESRLRHEDRELV